MLKSQWYPINCTDCGTAIAWSPVPIIANPVYCSLCACAHAQVATWMMPVGSTYSTNALYGVQTGQLAVKKTEHFRRVWNSLFAKLQAHQVAKAMKKNGAK